MAEYANQLLEPASYLLKSTNESVLWECGKLALYGGGVGLALFLTSGLIVGSYAFYYPCRSLLIPTIPAVSLACRASSARTPSTAR